ncbi:MAG: NADPH:quinone reductase [Solirubrobacterales bacterium]|jgi:NADPH2:quinone reductase|nr:NADPH:quinone reductase [Solirubrobacterales bacterium]
MKAIQLTEFSGADAMKYVDVPDPEAGDGEIVVEVERCGVNFADTHVTRNDYLAKQGLPLIPGGEVSGRTPDGRRVAAILMNGGYAQKVAVPEAMLVPVPDEVSDEQAAGILLQGLTAHALIHKCAHLEPGETVVVEAAAGGTGSLAVQLAKRHGARVIGLASSPEKRELVERLGADATADSRADDLESAILEANGGKQVDAVFEMSGGEAFEASMRTLAPFGRMVTFGIASGDQNEVATGSLMRKSRAVIGFWLVHLFADPAAVGKGISDLLRAVGAGELEVVIGGVRPLSEARQVHEDLAGRRTQGKILLDPAA